VYVFIRSGTVWTQQARLVESDPEGDAFGVSVALSGDTALVGARTDNHGAGGGFDEGAAFIFARSETVWTQQAKLLASDAQQADRLGGSVALSDDTAVVGAMQDDHVGGLDHGSAYVFVQPVGGWTNMTETAKLTAFDTAPGDNFGVSVSLSGDTAIVGAWRDDHAGGGDAGSAYVFAKPPGGWVNMIETTKLAVFDPATGDNLGSSVALSGDTAFIGAWLDDHPPENVFNQAGSAYVFELEHDPPPGDCDFNCAADLNDYADLPTCMSGPATPSDEGCACYDLDVDADVDLLDFAALQPGLTGG
jgi:hypothetical protein